MGKESGQESRKEEVIEDIDRRITALFAGTKKLRHGWMTANEFADNPDTRTGFYLENGELKTDMGNAQPRHEIAKADLHEALLLRLRELGVKARVCSETAYRLNLYTVLIPDISVQFPPQPAEGRLFSSPPPLAIEIVSPGNGSYELRTKAKAYLAFGVQTVCVLDPETGASSLITEAGEEVVTYDLPLPGTEEKLDLRPLLDKWRGMTAK